MHFNFTKEIAPNYFLAEYGNLENARFYKVRDLNQNQIGQFFYHPKVCFWAFGEEDVRIDINKPFFKKSTRTIIDRKTNSAIGSYEKIGSLIGWGSSSFGYMDLGGKKYTADNLRTDVGYSIFKRSTWGHYKFRVHSHEEEAVYALQLHIPPYRPHLSPITDGKIFLSNNLQLLFAGLYLLEEFFEYEDRRSD